MDHQTTQQGKKSLLQNDSLLVCGMLAFYGVCILGLIGTVIWGLDRRSKMTSANATLSAITIATEQANSTATAVAHTTEQAQYEVIDRFDTNKNNWRRGREDNDYWRGNITIQSGVYLWEVEEIKDTFFSWADFSTRPYIGDFDVYVDSKIQLEDGTAGDVCSGFVFRTASDDWEKGAYAFSVCNNSYFSVEYYEQEQWETILSPRYSSVIHDHDWNRLAISARGDHFTFNINNSLVYEMTDDRLAKGGLALIVEVNEESPVSIWFDNFGFQSR